MEIIKVGHYANGLSCARADVIGYVYKCPTCCEAFCRLSKGSDDLLRNSLSLFSRGAGSFLRWGLGAWYSILWNTRLRAANTAFTAHTGSLVSPTKKVTSQSSGIDAKNFMSSAKPDLFSNVLKSGSASAIAVDPATCRLSGITFVQSDNFKGKHIMFSNKDNYTHALQIKYLYNMYQ